jgi:hypothetical protein
MAPLFAGELFTHTHESGAELEIILHIALHILCYND